MAARRGKKISELETADLDLDSMRCVARGRAQPGRQGALVGGAQAVGLRTFVQYLRREDVIEHDPTADGRRAQTRPDDPGHISRRPRSTALLETPDAGEPLGRRDRAILELFYASGLRLSELVGVDLEDLNLQRADGAGDGQGRQGAAGAVQPAAGDAIRAWMKDRADRS